MASGQQLLPLSLKKRHHHPQRRPGGLPLFSPGHKRRGLNNQIIKEQGWLITLKAQKLVIVDTENEYVYLFDWATLKKFINDNLDNPSVCTIQEKENRFDRQCLTKAALIRIDTLIGNGLVEARRKYKIVEV